MGIERFFSSINKNFDIVSVMSNIKKLKTDVFFIDFNSIIHYVSSKYISEINTKGNINKNNTYDENSLILRVKNYVDDLLENEVLKNFFISDIINSPYNRLRNNGVIRLISCLVRFILICRTVMER